MIESLFIDFHTHKPSRSNQVLSIVTYDINENLSQSPANFYTTGIHPWSIDSASVLEDLKTLEKRISDPKLIAVGEIGLDKVNGPSFDLQKGVFIRQIEIAYQQNKPIIIHCVKAWDELIAIKQKFPDSLPWAVHGFYGSGELARQLIEKGFYLSVGSSLQKPNSKVVSALKYIPLNRLFFETDTSEVDIAEIYKLASQILHLSVDEMKGELTKNFKVFFRLPPLYRYSPL